ncbi:hypothetical protein ACVWWG_003349 [Bradyrhizobium sp. LB7.2]
MPGTQRRRFFSDALLSRGPCLPQGWVPALRSSVRTLQRVRDTRHSFPAFFTASARLAFADPGFSGCCWLACGAQPESQMMSNVA